MFAWAYHAWQLGFSKVKQIIRKGDTHGYLNRESWAGKEKVILALLKPLKIFFDDNTITHKINHGKIVKQMVVL